MATPFNDQRVLDRARAPGGLERVAAVAHFDEAGFPVGAHARPADRALGVLGVLAALVKHPRWIDRDM